MIAYMRGVDRKRADPDGSGMLCVRGHRLTPENVYLPKRGLGECRACRRTARRRADATYRARQLGVFIEDVDPYVRFEMDSGICGLCHEPVDPEDFHVDHITPFRHGGLHCYGNTQTAHPRCNLRKGTRLLSELPVDIFTRASTPNRHYPAGVR